MKSENTKDKGGVCAGYRKQIVDMVEKIDNLEFLVKIFSFVKVFFEE